MEKFEILSHGDGEYRVQVHSSEGDTALTVVLFNADDASDGQLTDDEMTARATISYLLGHQEASDLPERIELEDVIAAYPDAVSGIEALRA